jgi:Flp pilus assembly pilin Flp
VFLSLMTMVHARRSGLRDRWVDETGAVATEYVLLLVFIAVAIVAAVTIFGVTLAGKYKEVCDTVC